jgi:hypothetical protein
LVDEKQPFAEPDESHPASETYFKLENFATVVRIAR